MDVEERAPEEQKIPMGQTILDEMFFWFFLSVVTSLVFYNLWGLLDLLSLPTGGGS